MHRSSPLENGRDVTFGEDAPGSGPALPPHHGYLPGNLPIGLIRQAGHHPIAATIRKIKHDTALLLAVLGLSNPPVTSPNDFAGHPEGALRQHAGL